MQPPIHDGWGPRQWLRARLGDLAFLRFLAYPVAHHHSALAAAGLAVFVICYVRVVWHTTPGFL